MESEKEIEVSELAQRRIRRVNWRYCPHCERSVSVKTFKTHKRLYFNSVTNNWCVRIERMSDLPEVGSGNEDSDSPPGSVGHMSTFSNDDMSLEVPFSDPE